jgi:alpha-mannosidase
MCRPLYYTFGNHMHWVDMEWLWGYDVLPSSVQDMLRLCREAGVKGHVNFDAIGYEKLAVEAPDALAALRAAIGEGLIEIVGASYGQPYGLFHGGESNIRQRTFGVRTVVRLLGVRPHTFWEEEFDFFPQLPQILRGVGYEYAALFFQWTWHTPFIPSEEAACILWEGMDGSRLLAVPRNSLNLHQWPEDFEGLLESPALQTISPPLLLQWLELMPSPDWMCRTDVILPPLRALRADSRFQLMPVTLSEFLRLTRASARPRRYDMSEVFHGVSLGKNADHLRRLSRTAEQQLLAAESLSAMVGFFGRPYPSWDVYPTWELEESWRELLAAQHHDNDECEGLCGFVGLRSYERSLGLSEHVVNRTMRWLARRVGSPVVYNPIGWQRDAVIHHPLTHQPILMHNLPPFGYRVISPDDEHSTPPRAEYLATSESVTLKREMLYVTVDRARGVITQIGARAFPDGVLTEGMPLASLLMVRAGKEDRFEHAEVELADQTIRILRRGRDGAEVNISITLAADREAVDVHYTAHRLPRPDGGMNAALRTFISVGFPYRLFHDHPYGVSEIDPKGNYLKKYPSGDWMTSPQWFEQVHQPFTALQLLDFVDATPDAEERGLLVLHDGSQAFFGSEGKIAHILTMYDPWDEDYFHDSLDVRIRLIPHARISHAQRWKLAQEFTRPAYSAADNTTHHAPKPPTAFGCIWCEPSGVVPTAFYREMKSDIAPYPYILRLVEFDGQATTVRLRVPGQVRRACKTNLLGELLSELVVEPAEPPLPGLDIWSAITLDMRPYEIATLYLDLELGRKVARDLDAHRSVWATVHRV